MDSHTLKGRPPYPFETIAVYVAFTTRLQDVLAEAGYLAGAHNARLILVCIEKETLPLKTALENVCARSGLNLNETTVIWETGEPIKILLQICKDNAVDLLILETLRREKALCYYLGSVARGVSRRAKCSLLLLTDPPSGNTHFQKIIVSGAINPKTPFTLNTAVYFAQHAGVKDITIITEFDQPALAMATAYTSGTAENIAHFQKQLTSEEADSLHTMVGSCHPEGINIIEETIVGRPGYAIRQHAKSKNADLLIINSPDSRYGILDRIFTHDMEYILEDLPCNVLIVHSRIS
jgi:nucleotide-binding universal stress UspA family protein